MCYVVGLLESTLNKFMIPRILSADETLPERVATVETTVHQIADTLDQLRSDVKQLQLHLDQTHKLIADQLAYIKQLGGDKS